MIIAEVKALNDFTLRVKASDGSVGIFDVKPYLEYDLFKPLKNIANFVKVSNGGYFIEWECGVDLSADTIETKMKIIEKNENMVSRLRENSEKKNLN